MMEVSGFTTTSELGRGGFGTVYRATDHVHGRDVALKVLDRFDDEGAQRRFDRERLAMGRLSGHPNIAVVYNSGFTSDERPFIAMELLTGGSLADRLDEQGPLDAHQVVEIGAQLCQALAHAHAGGVLHLDMKPENALFSEFGTVKVVDFGIAALLDDTRTTAILATPAYADPRVLEGESGTTSSDVYGVAATLFTLLSGAAPYSSPSGALGTLNKIANDPVPRIDAPGVPDALADCLHRAMAKQPADRQPSIVDFGRELTESLHAPAAEAVPVATSHQNVAPAVPPLTPPAPSRATPQRDRSATIGIGLLALAALLLVGFVVIAVVGRDDSNNGDSGASPSIPDSLVDEEVEPTVPLDTTAVTTPAVVPPSTNTPASGPAAANPRFSLQTADGLPDPEVFLVPPGSTQLCLTWSYSGFEPGAFFEYEWLIDGVLDTGSLSAGTNQGGSVGDFFGCVSNGGGLIDGLYEAIWRVSGQQVFTHSLFVGGDRQPVTIGIQNNRTEPVCEVYWTPVGSTSVGLVANPTDVPPGGRFETTLPTGNYRTVVRDCAGTTVFEETDTAFSADDTLTLTP